MPPKYFLTVLEVAARWECTQAEVIGWLAVHRSIGVKLFSGEPAFVITHVPTGRLLSGEFAFDTAEEAKAAAIVVSVLPIDWSAKRIAQTKGSEHLKDAMVAIMAVCGAFLVEVVPEHQVGLA